MYKEANQANIIGSLANNTLDLIIWWSTSGALLLVFDWMRRRVVVWGGGTENVKVFKAYYTYDGLSLIAEIGGYVGLFLGWSVQQLFEIPKKLADIKRCMPQELTIQN